MSSKDVKESAYRETPFEKSPFQHGKRFPTVDPQRCSDLLLDVAATTAIASLTDGTPVLKASSAISYMCFLGLVWWIWGSQVLYNVRFRQKDWLHRIFVVLQLLTFCALAAYAGSFDISKGIVSEGDDDSGTAFVAGTQAYIEGNVAVEEERSQYLSLVNSTGISGVLAFSRLVLLIQYTRVWSCAFTTKNEEFARMAKFHIVTLFISMLSYTTSVVVVRTDNGHASRGASIAKVLLWILPIFVELAVHFFVNREFHRNISATSESKSTQPAQTNTNANENKDLKDWLQKEISSLIERADTVFVILLGVGLDRITVGFQRIAGNIVLASRGALLIISTGIIFVTQLTLYFGLKKRINGRMAHFNVLTWFFFNFFHFAALILTLQGTGALLELSNMVGALDLPLRVVYTLGDAVRLQPARLLNPDPDYTFLRPHLTKIGLSLDNMVYFINNGTVFFYSNDTLPGIDRSDPLGSMFGLVRMLGTVTLRKLLQNLKAAPETGDPLDVRINSILTATISNSTDIELHASKLAFGQVLDDVRKFHAESASWFFGVAGATLVLQAILWAILHPDLCKYMFERWIVGLRTSFGITSILLLTISADNNNPPDQISDSVKEYIFRDTLMHRLAQQGWMLFIFAGLIGLEQILEQVVGYHIPRHAIHQAQAANEDHEKNLKGQGDSANDNDGYGRGQGQDLSVG